MSNQHISTRRAEISKECGMRLGMGAGILCSLKHMPAPADTVLILTNFFKVCAAYRALKVVGIVRNESKLGPLNIDKRKLFGTSAAALLVAGAFTQATVAVDTSVSNFLFGSAQKEEPVTQVEPSSVPFAQP
ncbi:MAG: hypothetical protein DI551_05720 [Micavibrio aeruginosavorus]|uniref:Uncharacterized protein n=1 Tax=Micavibrio aeruginosavorus TaxID=349221 RepID=A0A2W5PN60_9BACT|nr:MAG: hypothetical protein DI551_05720 [Micavibrio aeruginosavorus]